MTPIPGYELRKVIHEGLRVVVYRGVRLSDHRPVVLKLLRDAAPSRRDVSRLQREYDLLMRIKDPGVIRALDFVRAGQRAVLVLDDFGGISLREFVGEARPLDVTTFLKFALALVNALSSVHAAGVIHRDIKPENIIVDPETERVVLADFSSASQLSEELQAVANPDTIEGTLQYMSPEQTGRMNRSIDYRSDYYSLGVTFFELLTGQRPFIANTALELVFCHIARRPRPPRELVPTVPEALSKIVLKLLSKTAEGRYQSTRGLRGDIERCQSQWLARGRIEDFKPGLQDVSERFQVPGTLYGREDSVSTLLDSIDRVGRGSAEVVLVSGPSGIGKSAVIHEIHRPAVELSARFIAGKFDQLAGERPYASLVQAFAELVRQILTESDEALAYWKTQLSEALGANARVAVDMLPEFELILGPQPPMPRMPPTESANRFRNAVRSLVHAVAQPQHPLIIFLDDLQWSDVGTLKVLEMLMVDSETSHLLVLGAFRDGEVGPEHPLRQILGEIEASDKRVTQVALTPLNLDHTTSLVRDALVPAIEEPRRLARMVQIKTGGNPFFVGVFIKSLHEQGLIRFDTGRGAWTWDEDEVDEAGLTDNVVELMASKIEELSPAAREALKLAACVGNRFDLGLLSIVLEKSVEETADALWEAVEKRLIRPIGDAYRYRERDAEYQFPHDRIQQAAYAYVSTQMRRATHLRIGRLLLDSTTSDGLAEAVFTITGHLNIGMMLLTDPVERLRLAELNLLAGRRAKQSTAYDSAVSYLRGGIELLPEDAWTSCYELTFALYRERLEAEFLSGRVDEAVRLFTPLLANTRSEVEKGEIHVLKVVLDANQGDHVGAVATARAGLRLFDASLPVKGTTAAVLREFARVQWGLRGRKPLALLELPELRDPKMRVALQLLISMAPSTYFVDTGLLSIVMMRIANISLRKGLSDVAAYGFAGCGMVLSGALGAYATAKEFGELALTLNERFSNSWLAAKLDMIAGAFIFPWVRPLPEARAILRRGYQSGVQAGDLVYAGYNGVVIAVFLLLEGVPLDEAQAFPVSMIPFARRVGDIDRLQTMMVVARTCMALRRQTDALVSLGSDDFSEDAFVEELNDRDTPATSHYYYLYRAMRCYLAGSFEDAHRALREVEPRLEAAFANPTLSEFYFYEGMVAAARQPEAAAGKDRRKLVRKVVRCLNKLESWAGRCPSTFAARARLLAGELALIQGREGDALSAYSHATQLAREAGAMHIEAIALERTARCHLSRGEELVASTTLMAAREAYRRWGAEAKVSQLATEFREYLGQIQPGTIEEETGTHTGSGAMRTLDLGTVIQGSLAISSEIRLDRLLRNLIRISMENAGARRGFLILADDDRLLIEAEGSVDPESVEVLQSTPVERSALLPASIVKYVARTRSDVVLDDAATKGDFSLDPFVSGRKLKSVLCTPILHQGKLTGVLYLENNLTSGAFTPQRIEVLRVLSSQAAISIENARLYRNLQDSLTQQVALTDAHRRFVPHEFIKSLGRESITDVELGDYTQKVLTVLFSDIRGFTTLVEQMTPEQSIRFINTYLSHMEPAILRNGGFIDSYIGDAIMALFDTPADEADDGSGNGSGDAAVRAAVAMLRGLRRFNEEREREGEKRIGMGIGINTGHLTMGTIGGYNRLKCGVIGDPVNLASRIESLTRSYSVPLLISEHTYNSFRNPDEFCIRLVDLVQVVGQTKPVTLYEVYDAATPDEREVKLSLAPRFETATHHFYRREFDDALTLFGECREQMPDDQVIRSFMERCHELRGVRLGADWTGVRKLQHK